MEWNCKLLVICFLYFVPFGSHALDSLRVERDNGQSFVIHRVEKGETLYSLSRRYGSVIEEVVEENGIIDNQLSLHQEVRFPISQTAEEYPKSPSGEIKHTVAAGETLFGISRIYEVTVDDIKEWNSLTSNEISIGQVLLINKTDSVSSELIEEEVPDKMAKVEAGFKVHYVQTGELLEGIASKYGVRPDSIVEWNDLTNTYLSIGQKLLIRGELDTSLQQQASDLVKTPYGKIKKTTDPSGLTRVFEEGVASKIESSVETEKYLALHRTLKVGSLIEVRNLMNNQKIFVRVVGKLPETGINQKVLVRLTPVCFERLGIIDPKTRVEISYYED